MTKYYAQICTAAGFFSEDYEKPVESRNATVELTGRDYAYRIFEREEVQLDGETLIGKPKNYGPRHIKGEVYDCARVEREVENNDILLSNMRINGWAQVIRCAQGFIPMEEGDVLL